MNNLAYSNQPVPKDLAIGIKTNKGVVYLHDVLHITTEKGRKLTNALITRIDGWSPVPVKVEWRNDEGILVKEAVNLNTASWCHAAGQIGSKIH